jgi:predicted ester cyclase
MSQLDAVKIVESFWKDVWAACNPEAIDRYVVEDFTLTTGGVDIRTKDAFKRWVREFQSKILDLEFETIESFQNADGSRVASRWRVRGRNNGIFGLPPDGRPIEFTGTAVWAVRADGRLLHNWVERSAWELYQRLTS